MVVTNPTAIHQKAQTLHVLEADLLALSETSATATVQAQFSREFAKLGYKSVWGYPAPAQLSAGNQDSLRGAAIGVSMHSKFPIRAARNQPESPWHQAGRFMHTFVQLPGIEIQVCNLYGLPASVATAKQRTNSLLEFAHHCIRHTTFPGIICGDLNHHPDTLDAWTALRSAGYRTAESIFRDLNGRDMPATYGDATKHDVCLLHPILASMVTSVWVDNQKLLAGHNPLGITFAIPTTSPLKPTWKLPESWIALQPNSMYFQQCYEPMYSDGKTVATAHSHLHPLQEWATKIETAIDAAIAAEHEENPQFQPHKKLPKKHRGRCQDLKITHAQLPRSIKQAPHGQYTPDVDHASIKLRQFTRQIRRLQSLKTRMKKHESQGSTQRILDQLSEEWNCILHARGFGATFWDWLHNMPELQGIPESLPTADYLHQAEQLLKHEAKHMEYEHKTRSTKHAQYLQALDATRFGKRMAYKKIKEPSPGLVSVVEINRTATADVLQQPQFGLMTLSRPSNMHLDAAQPLYINTFATTITQLDEWTVECMIHDEILELPKQVSIQQIHETAAPSEVADRLTEFWSQYWNRDSPEAQHNQEHWSQFHELKSLVPKLPRFPISLTSLEDWIMAVKALKSSTARGCCGWSADELKMLSTDCIADLMYICRPPASWFPTLADEITSSTCGQNFRISHSGQHQTNYHSLVVVPALEPGDNTANPKNLDAAVAGSHLGVSSQQKPPCTGVWNADRAWINKPWSFPTWMGRVNTWFNQMFQYSPPMADTGNADPHGTGSCAGRLLAHVSAENGPALAPQRGTVPNPLCYNWTSWRRCLVCPGYDQYQLLFL